MKLPQQDHLSRADIIKWSKNLLIFSTPAIIAFLTAIQTGGFEFALGAGYSAMLAGVIDLYGKYKAGVKLPEQSTDVQQIKPGETGDK